MSPLSYFLVICSPSGDTQGPSVVFEAVDMTCARPFHFPHIADYIYDINFVLPLKQMLVFLSLYVMLSILLIHVGPCGCTFVLCLFGQCPSICTICLAGSTHDLYTCLFRQMAKLLLKISRCLACAAQAAMLLRCTYLSWFLSLRIHELSQV